MQDIVDAAQDLLGRLDETQRSRLSYHIDSPEWRTWSNPEFLLSDKGVRLDELSEAARASAMGLIQATLSPEGYEKAVGAMRINGFLGELVRAPAVMNEFSYNLVLFGDGPSTTRPWGFSFYGHHLCLSVFLYGTQMVVSPWFTGAEPNLIDEGPHRGTRILEVEERLGLQLMRSLAPDLRARAQVFGQLKDPDMPHGRWNHDDQRHLCGAYRDNRVVPYEGIPLADLAAPQLSLVADILEQYLLFLPQTARRLRLDQAKSWFHETYFCWIGGYGDADPFYYRIQSPVIIIEFDHHSGVFLTNSEPAKFHIHTPAPHPQRRRLRHGPAPADSGHRAELCVGGIVKKNPGQTGHLASPDLLAEFLSIIQQNITSISFLSHESQRACPSVLGCCKQYNLPPILCN